MDFTNDICTGLFHCSVNTLNSINTCIVYLFIHAAFIHSASRCSEDPTMLQAQSSEMRTQRWIIPAPEGYQKKTDGWMRNQGNVQAVPSSTFILLPSQPPLSVFQWESHHQSEQPTGVILSPHLTSLDPKIFISHLSNSLPLVPQASCWHLFSSLSLFFMTNLDLACPFPHFHSGCTLPTLPTWSLEFLFSLNLCGDFARSIQAAKFHFNLLSLFTCSGHCTGGESHENVPAGTVPNLSSVASTWPFQWLCCSFIYISFMAFADIFFTSQGLSLTPVSLTQSRQACLWCSVDHPEDSAELSDSPSSQSWYSSHCSKFLFLVKSHVLSEQLISSFQD